MKEKCQAASNEQHADIEENKLTVKRPRLEASSSLPTATQHETLRCRGESLVPTTKLPLRVKDEPVELPQPELKAPVHPMVSIGPAKDKENNPAGKCL